MLYIAMRARWHPPTVNLLIRDVFDLLRTVIIALDELLQLCAPELVVVVQVSVSTPVSLCANPPHTAHNAVAIALSAETNSTENKKVRHHTTSSGRHQNIICTIHAKVMKVQRVLT